jgi:hypothetical protein
MVLQKRGNGWYGEGQADIHEEIARYASLNGYQADHFADAVCGCGSRQFGLSLDDNAGAAVRRCAECKMLHPIGDSSEYIDEAKLEDCACPCGQEALEISAGVSLYDGSRDVRWLYLGCRCPQCGLTAVYGDWKNECEDYQTLLTKV